MVKDERLTTCFPFQDTIKQLQVVLHPNKGEHKEIGKTKTKESGKQREVLEQQCVAGLEHKQFIWEGRMASSGRVVCRKKEEGVGMQQNIIVSDPLEC